MLVLLHSYEYVRSIKYQKRFMYLMVLYIWPNLEELLYVVEEKAAPGPS